MDKEQKYFFKVAIIVVDLLSENLRKLFVGKWNSKYPNQKWENTSVSGNLLLSRIPTNVRKPMKDVAENLRSGDVKNWDPTTLFWVFQQSGLNLIQPSRPLEQMTFPLLHSEYLDIARGIRNECFAHATKASIQFNDFRYIVTKFMTFPESLFGMSFYKDLNKIVKSDITKTKSEQLKSPLEVQMKVNSAYVEWLEDIQVDIETPTEVIKGAPHIEYHAPVTYINVSDEASATFGTFEQGTNRTYERVGTVLESVSGDNQVTTGYAVFACPSLQGANGDKEAVVSKPQSANDFSGLRERYRKECAKHEVNCVEHGCIMPLNVDIQDFAVNLRIREEKKSPAVDKTFHGEMARHMESLKDDGQNIEVGELLNMVQENNKHRIFFVGGVAGIGKSVLAKRIAYDWSCSEVYRHIKCLLYITCRKLNIFLQKSDKEFEVEDIEKYFEDVPVRDDKATLFLIDGLDELQKPDLIQAFTEKFSQSSFLILGRHHSRHFVDKTKERYQHLEILGLDENQIQEYIEKFDKLSTTATENQQESVKSTANFIKSVSKSSLNISTIISIPQFLNTICCVFNLTTEEKVITSKTDLYSWTLFLLVNQHFGSKKSDGNISIVGWEKFSDYSQQLLQLCKQAFNLYISGKIIFKKTELECTDEAFIQGFLLGMKNKFGDIGQYMFKHLTMMEFFASIFVYLDENRTVLVNELLESRHYEVVSFLCSFLRFSLMDRGSFDEDDEVSYKLLQELSDGDKLKTSSAGRLITRKDAQNVILDILNKVGEIEDVKDQFLLKLRFISDCLEATDKVSDTSFLRNLLHTITPSSSVKVWLSLFKQQNLLTILRLASKNGLKEADIEKIFNGVEFSINDLKQMDILSYSRCLNIGGVAFIDIVEFTQSQSVLIHQNIAYCGKVQFYNCSVPSLPCSTSLTSPSPTATTTATSKKRKKKKRKKRKEMKLKELEMFDMKIDQSEVSSAANLFCLAEWVELTDVQVGEKEFEKIMRKVIQIKSRRLKQMELYCCPLANHEFKQKMRENGVMIGESFARLILILCEPDSRNFVLQLKENLDDKKYYIAVDENIEEFERRYYGLPSVLVVFIQHHIPEQVERDILFAQNEGINILLVKLEADFYPSNALSFVFDSSPCLDFTDKRNNAAMASELNRAISAIMLDEKFIIISNAPGNQVEAIEMKQKFAGEIGCPVFVNIELCKYGPLVVVALLTDEYEKSQQCKEMMVYAKDRSYLKIIAVKLDNDFQPGDELNKIVRESTCICWTDETNFDTNFAKVKKWINAEFAKER